MSSFVRALAACAALSTALAFATSAQAQEASDAEVAALVKKLQGSEADARIEAAESLGDLGPSAKEAVPALLDVLRAGVSDPSFAAFTGVGPSRVVKARRTLELTAAVLRAIGKIDVGGEPAIELLAAKLEAKETSPAAAHALALLGPSAKKAAPRLVHALGQLTDPGSSDEAYARLEIGVALIMITDRDAGLRALTLELAHRDTRVGATAGQIIQQLVAQDSRLQRRVGPVALAMVAETDARARYGGVLLLSLAPDAAKDAVPALVKALDGATEPLSSALTGTFLQIGAPAADALEAELAKGALATKPAVARILMALDRDAGSRFFLAELDSKDPAVRAAALEDLGVLGTQFSSQTSNAPANVRLKALLPRLLAELEDGDARVHRAALEALAAMDYFAFDGLALAPGSAPAKAVAAALEKGDEAERVAAAQVARKLIWAAHVSREKLVPSLIAALKDPSVAVRTDAAMALGSSDTGEAALAALATATEDKDPSVRCAAADAIGWIGSSAKAQVPALAKLVGDQAEGKGGKVFRSAFNALQRLGPDAAAAVPALVALLESSSVEENVKGEAAWVLANMGPAAKDALPALRKLATVASGASRSAQGAIERIEGHSPDGK